MHDHGGMQHQHQLNRRDEMRNYTPIGLPDQPDDRFGSPTDLSAWRRRPFLTITLLTILMIALIVIVVVAANASSGEFIEY